MADQSITQLPVAQTVLETDVTVLVQRGVTKQVNVSLLATAIAPGKLITNVIMTPDYYIEFFYSDGTTSTIGPIPGFENAYVDGNGHLILVETDGTLLDAGSVIGPQGTSGYSGYSGFSGISGYSGFSGISGYSGFSGISGYSGFSGISGYSGFSGISGYSGDSGFSGISGYSGDSGFSGISGYSGFSGISGYSGDSGISGYSGFSGISGYSGDSGISGFSGFSGISGYSGDSGISGFSGFSGISGYSGDSGISGFSGFSGFSGQQGTSINLKGEVPTVDDLPMVGNQPNDAYIVTADGDLWVWDGSAWFDAGQIVGPPGLSGYSGFSGFSGISGYSGDSGISGYSGDSGISGYSGTSGFSGFSGTSGYSGFSGISGYSGAVGAGGIIGNYGSFFDTTDQTGSLTQQVVSVNSTTSAIGFSRTGTGTIVIANPGTYKLTYSIQLVNTDNAQHYADIWLKYNGSNYPDSNTRFSIPARKSDTIFSYVVATVDFIGTSVNPNDTVELWWVTDSTQVLIETIAAYDGVPETPGVILNVSQVAYSTSGYSGFSGISGFSGYSGVGESGYSGYSGYSGQDGTIGVSGYSGFSGISGYSGFSGGTGSDGASGYSGYSGWSGAEGPQGVSGYSGYSGAAGAAGASGYSGISGFSGYSGYSGYSGNTAQMYGTAAVKAIFYNNSSIAENITTVSGYNGLSAGPISVEAGNTVTVVAGSNWTIV